MTKRTSLLPPPPPMGAGPPQSQPHTTIHVPNDQSPRHLEGRQRKPKGRQLKGRTKKKKKSLGGGLAAAGDPG